MNSFEEVFDLVKKNLDISDISRKLWIEPIKPVGLKNNTVTLFVESTFLKERLEENWIPLLKKYFKEILGFDVKIIIQCGDESDSDGVPRFVPIPELEDDKVMVQKLSQSLEGSNYKHTFDTFIEGDSNKLAYTACKAVAQGQKNFNPLYIYGDPGLGKTHLLSAVKNEITQTRPELNIVFTSSDNFVNDYVNSLRLNKIVEFKNKYRNTDVLLLDDVQFFSGKEESQQELFNTFNELHANNKQIIFTSDRAPKEISGIEKRLQGRFEWGLLADISVPEFETRIAIVERKAKLIGLIIQQNVIEYIADKLKNNIRQLEGVIIKMNELSLVMEIPPTITMARDVVNEILDQSVPATITVEKVINEVASMYGLSGEEIRSKKRSANISTARQIAIYVVHKITGLSYSEIGEQFGGRDHSTVVYAVNKVKAIIQNNKEFRKTIDDLIKNLSP